MGTPKALLYDDQGRSFLARSVAVLRDGGCDSVCVVLGAGADEAAALVDGAAAVVVAADWAEGMGASLRAGLRAAVDTEADRALVTLVDLPDVGAPVVRRVLEAGAGGSALARAVYEGLRSMAGEFVRTPKKGITAGRYRQYAELPTTEIGLS